MARYAIPEPQIQTLPIVGKDEVFPVRRVYCIGRNYAAHAVEMGHDPDKEDPFFFQKNPDNLNLTRRFPYPPKSSDVHHEAEVLVALKSGGTNIEYADAMSHVYGYALCLDMTRRDRQGEMKKAGRPWEIGKAFEHSAPCGPLHLASDVGHPTEGDIVLTVNGELRQEVGERRACHRPEGACRVRRAQAGSARGADAVATRRCGGALRVLARALRRMDEAAGDEQAAGCGGAQPQSWTSPP